MTSIVLGKEPAGTSSTFSCTLMRCQSTNKLSSRTRNHCFLHKNGGTREYTSAALTATQHALDRGRSIRLLILQHALQPALPVTTCLIGADEWLCILELLLDATNLQAGMGKSASACKICLKRCKLGISDNAQDKPVTQGRASKACAPVRTTVLHWRQRNAPWYSSGRTCRHMQHA